MSDQVGLRARKYNLFAKNIAITFKTLDIYNNVLILFEKIKFDEKIRSIGIRLGDLSVKNMEQVSLFSTKSDDNIQKLLDNINSKYHNTVVMPAIFYEKDK